MSEGIQLDLNLEDKNSQEIKFELLQKQIDQMNESMGKVRRKLFANMTELRKENHELRQKLELMESIQRNLTNTKTEWVYHENGLLFDIKAI